jgi:hypothetical protein
MNEYQKAAIITGTMDIFLLIVLFKCCLNIFDKFFTISIILIHFIFLYGLYGLYGLYSQSELLIDVLHGCIFLYLFLGIFLENKYLLGITLFLTIIIQLLWVIEERCILNKTQDQFGYSKELSFFMIFLTVILSMKLSKKI